MSLGGGATDDLTRYAGDILKDPEADMNGREFADYDHIRCYFNEYPIRGYFKQSGIVAGKPNFNFVRVYPWKNEAGEEGGLVVVPNHDYDEDKIVADDNVTYDMCTLMPHIHPDSFTHFGFKKPLKVVGDSTVGVNYDVMIRDKSYIPDNDYNDKFRLVARHEFRWSNKYPEFSGCIAYRHGRRKGYVLEVVDRDDTPAPDEFATGMDMKVCDDITDASLAQCAACDDQVPEADGDCVAPGDLADATVALLPAEEAITGWTGEASTVRLEVRRTGEIAQASSVDVTAEAAAGGDLAASGEVLATAGTHFTAVAATTLSWEAGERDSKFLDIPITGATGDTDLAIFKVSLGTYVNAAAAAGADVTFVKIEDLTV